MYKKMLLMAGVLLFCYDISFASSLDTKIILSPHFDDAALPLGGMLSQYEGTKIVATVFSGKPQTVKVTLWDRISGFFSSNNAIETRQIENERSLRVLGASSLELGFLDYQYRNKSKKTTEETTAEIKSKIIDLLKSESDKGKIEVYFPAYFGPAITHPDHLIVHSVALDIIKSGVIKNAVWYMYEDAPYVIGYTKHNKQDLKSFLIGKNPNFSITEKNIILTKKDLDLKAESIGRYGSQVKAFHGMGDSVKEIINFNKKRCGEKACEKVYEVSNKFVK